MLIISYDVGISPVNRKIYFTVMKRIFDDLLTKSIIFEILFTKKYYKKHF